MTSNSGGRLISAELSQVSLSHSTSVRSLGKLFLFLYRLMFWLSIMCLRSGDIFQSTYGDQYFTLWHFLQIRPGIFSMVLCQPEPCISFS